MKNPTYEDMIMLSSLLGPAKPPVASREDVATRLGVFLISWHINGNDLRAVALEGDDFLSITSTERCLVCLTEYEIGEEVRRLDKCSHVFHRECIDTVSFHVPAWEDLVLLRIIGSSCFSGLPPVETPVPFAAEPVLRNMDLPPSIPTLPISRSDTQQSAFWHLLDGSVLNFLAYLSKLAFPGPTTRARLC